jgi:RHS repeat-associated protein
MKKIIIVLILFPFLVFSQSTDQNYVKSITYKQPTTSSVTNPDITIANTQVSYFNGLGKPVQQIAYKQSNTGKDIVTHIEYDQHGRQTKEYLPFVSSSASLNYLYGAQSEVLNFYSSPTIAITGNPNFEATTNPYNENQLESSPLSRVLKKAFPGNPWVLGGGKEIKYEYQTNIANEVKLFRATATWNSSTEVYDISVIQSGNYQANQLFKTITKNENWTSGNNNTIQEFTDKEGNLVLKRAFNNNIVYDTYFIHDQYGNLTYVLPPLAESSIDFATIENLCYQYKYDARNRLVEKKLPGKQWEFIVYDKLDRPIAIGPAFSPYGNGTVGLIITEYDIFDRIIQTGWKTLSVSNTDRKNYQTSINSGINPFVLGTNDILTKNYYDNYSFIGAPSPLPTSLPDSAFPLATNVKGLSTGSWVKVLDNPTSSSAEISYTLYDEMYRPIHNKTINHKGGYTQIDTNLDWFGKTNYTLTRHKRTNANTEIVIKDIFEYTDQGRLEIHKQQINSLPEQLIVKNFYDELGQLISKNVGGTDITGSTSLQQVDYTYNIRGWLKAINDVDFIGADLFAFKVNYNIPETATPLFNGNISETFWKTSSDNNLRKYDYTYDHLNRLLRADYSKEGSTSFNSYLEHLTYDKNGNIQTLQRNGGMDTDGYQFENPIDDLTYLYDNLNKNRLLRVFDATANASGFKDDTDGTDVNIDINQAPDYTYDLNGNMISDANKGIQNITYNHLNLPVQIVFPNGIIDYIYNANGQKVEKTFIEAGVGSTVDYLDGFQYKNKVLQFFPHAEGYVNATENAIIGGGTSYTFNYVFSFKDHLGNIRLNYSKDPITSVLRIIEENHYYPFGLKHSGYNSDRMMYLKEGSVLKIKPVPPLFKTINNYKFENKEWQDELGLNVYDFHARNYMPDIGRTTTYDPMAEDFYDFSPQSFLNNNPMSFIDPTGMSSDWIPKVNEDGSISYIAEKGDTAETFAKQYNISMTDAQKIVGNTTSEGTEITGQQVVDVLGLGKEALKLDLKSGLDTPQRKIDQFIFAMHHSKSKGANGFMADEYFQNILTGELQPPQLIKGNVTLENGKKVSMSMTLPFYTSTGHIFKGSKYHIAFYSNNPSNLRQGKGSMFGGNQSVNHYVISYGFKIGNKMSYQSGGIWMSTLTKNQNSFEKTIFEREIPNFRYNALNINTKN